jgi:sugar phosphate isomerase/epimerase
MWNPILDVFDECGVRFALEVHPTEIAFDPITTRRALDAVGNRPAFGINLDPSHLQWQMVDPARFVHEFPDRIYHVHVKDVAVQLTGRNSILGSHLNFGSAERGWDFRSPGHGDVDFEALIRALNHIHYEGPLSVEWEDSGMDREFGAKEAFEFIRKLNFSPSAIAFDENF